jgi:hypothetical protein
VHDFVGSFKLNNRYRVYLWVSFCNKNRVLAKYLLVIDQSSYLSFINPESRLDPDSRRRKRPTNTEKKENISGFKKAEYSFRGAYIQSWRSQKKYSAILS